MNTFYLEEDGTYDVACGSDIVHTIDLAILMSRADKEKKPFTFHFNEVVVTVDANSDAGLILRDWQRATSGYIDKQVGPHPKEVLSLEEIASDMKIAVENELRWLAQEAEYQAKAEAKCLSVMNKLKDAPGIDLKRKEAWKQFVLINKDSPYGMAAIDFAERWARMMQLEIASGKTVAEAAEITQYEANTDGITGFQFGAAASMLSRCWKYGDDLRRWHNGNYGVNKETVEIVNPAILVVSDQSDTE